MHYSALELANFLVDYLMGGDHIAASKIIPEIKKAVKSLNDEVSSESDELAAPEGAQGAS